MKFGNLAVLLSASTAFAFNSGTFPVCVRSTSPLMGAVGSYLDRMPVNGAPYGTGMTSHLDNFQATTPYNEQWTGSTNQNGIGYPSYGGVPNPSMTSYLDNFQSSSPLVEQRRGSANEYGFNQYGSMNRYGTGYSYDPQPMNGNTFGPTYNAVSVPATMRPNQSRASVGTGRGSTDENSRRSPLNGIVESSTDKFQSMTGSTNGSFGSTLNGVSVSPTDSQNRNRASTSSVMSSYWDNMSQSTSPPPRRMDNVQSTRLYGDQRTGRTNGRDFGSTLNGVPATSYGTGMTSYMNNVQYPRPFMDQRSGSTNGRDFGSTMNGVPATSYGNMNNVQSPRPFMDQRSGSTNGRDFGSTMNGVPATSYGTGMTSYMNNVQSPRPFMDQRTRNTSGYGTMSQNYNQASTGYGMTPYMNNMSTPYQSTSTFPGQNTRSMNGTYGTMGSNRSQASTGYGTTRRLNNMSEPYYHTGSANKPGRFSDY